MLEFTSHSIASNFPASQELSNTPSQVCSVAACGWALRHTRSCYLKLIMPPKSPVPTHPLHLTTDPSIPDSHIPGVMTTTIPDVMETTNGPISPAQIGAGVEAIRGQRGWLILVRGADYRRGDDLLEVISPRSRTLCSLVLCTQESKVRHQHSQPF